jgi:hypothetical protein
VAQPGALPERPTLSAKSLSSDRLEEDSGGRKGGDVRRAVPWDSGNVEKWYAWIRSLTLNGRLTW